MFKIPFFRKKKKKKKKGNGVSKFDTEGSLNQQKNLEGFFCENPFEKVEIHANGRMYPCCSGWINLPYGNAETTSIKEMWNGEAAQKFRASILDGSFRHCYQKICPAIQKGDLPTIEEAKKNPKHAAIIENKTLIMEDNPTSIDFSHDRSCNLACPSCRTSKVLLTEGKQFTRIKSIHDKLVDEYFSEPTDRHFAIKVTGSGDPFASKMYREFLYDLDGSKFPNLKVNLQTNAVMFTEKNWQRIHKVHKNLGYILVSCDAATPETYAPIRKGGDWDLLMKNLEFLGQRRAERMFKYFRLDFVVQADNFHEMPAYVDMAKKYNADVVYFMFVRNWGTWSKEDYEQKCIWKQTHPRFKEFMEILRDDRLGESMVDLGNITRYRELAVEQA